METISNVVVVGSDKNPAKLHTRLDPVRLRKDMAMAVTSISHGEAFNVTKQNNSFKMGMIKQLNDVMSTVDEHVLVTVPEGRYNTSLELLNSVYNEMEIALLKHGHAPTTISKIQQQDKITISTELIMIFAEGSLLWNLLGVTKNIKENSSVTIEKQKLKNGIEPAFLYVNIVESSYINGILSRNLAVLPINLAPGCSFYEFQNPVYIPVIVKDFSDILLEIRDLHGEYVKFVPGCSVVISLNLRPIKGHT